MSFEHLLSLFLNIVYFAFSLCNVMFINSYVQQLVCKGPKSVVFGSLQLV